MSKVKVIEMVTDKKGYTRSTEGINDLCCFSPSTDEFLGLDIHTRYAVQLIPIPGGFRLATAEDRKGGKPPVYKIWRNLVWENIQVWSPEWLPNRPYIIPIESRSDKKREELRERLRKAEEEVAAVRKALSDNTPEQV